MFIQTAKDCLLSELTMSPYPTVVTVTMMHQNDAGMLVKGVSSKASPAAFGLMYLPLTGSEENVEQMC